MNKLFYLYKKVHFRGFSTILKIGLKNQMAAQPPPAVAEYISKSLFYFPLYLIYLLYFVVFKLFVFIYIIIMIVFISVDYSIVC